MYKCYKQYICTDINICNVKYFYSVLVYVESGFEIFCYTYAICKTYLMNECTILQHMQ